MPPKAKLILDEFTSLTWREIQKSIKTDADDTDKMKATRQELLITMAIFVRFYWNEIAFQEFWNPFLELMIRDPFELGDGASLDGFFDDLLKSLDELPSSSLRQAGNAILSMPTVESYLLGRPPDVEGFRKLIAECIYDYCVCPLCLWGCGFSIRMFLSCLCSCWFSQRSDPNQQTRLEKVRCSHMKQCLCGRCFQLRRWCDANFWGALLAIVIMIISCLVLSPAGSSVWNLVSVTPTSINTSSVTMRW